MGKTDTNADMSHQKRLRYKLEEIVESVRINGVGKTVEKIGRHLYYRFRGIDFETENIYHLTRTGAYVDHGTALVSTSQDFFLQVMEDLERRIGHEAGRALFLDYGSGKGGAIIQARRYGFKKAVGVEFAKELHEIAERNIRKLGLDQTYSVWGDATEYPPPANTSVIYLFNPFDAVVMERVAENIEKMRDRFATEVYLIYGNPSCEEVLDSRFEQIGSVAYPTGARVLFYRI